MRKLPNILIIITHDTGRHLGCYNRGVNTPNLDQLSKEGVIFTKAFCTAPQCSPSRASLLTGMYPHNHGLIGLTHRGFKLNENVPLMPKIFTSAGYSTYLFGFQHEINWGDEKKLGYQNVMKGKTNSCKDITPLLLNFLRNKPSKPFFTMAGFSETHRKFPKLEDETEIDKTKVPSYLYDVPEIRRDIAELNIAVRDVDNSIGQILKTLEQTGLAKNTIIVYTTDHGIAFPGAKATLFDPGIEIALLIRGPYGFSGGKTIQEMVSNMDILPTLIETCKITKHPQIQGKSFAPLVQDQTKSIHDEIFIEQTYHAAYDPVRGIRTKRYKYIRSFEKRPWWLPPNVDSGRMGGYTKEWYRINHAEVFKNIRPYELLFDLSKSPLEKNNLSNDSSYSKVLLKLQKQLEDWMKKTNDPLLAGYVKAPNGAIVTPLDKWDP